MVPFFAIHAAVLAALLLTAAGAGTVAMGHREGIALRSALGLAFLGHALFFLALMGQLRAVPIIALMTVAIVGGGLRARWPKAFRPALLAAGAAGIAPLFILALQPPLAFDETLYHLPFVRALALSGELRFLPSLRFPVFPQLHELLCVPPFLFAGDVATHLVSVAEVVIAAALLIEWGRRYNAHAGPLAAALFLGSPIVIYLGTITYVDAALMLFVAAGFYCLDRGLSEERLSSFVLSGLFFGTACSVKYLGCYFAFTALIIVFARASDRRRTSALLAIACAAAAVPTSAWLVSTTRNPLFPFMPHLFGASAWTMAPPPTMPPAERVVRVARVLWDVTFARQRMNHQPPFTPFLIVAVLLVLAAALRNGRARCVILMSIGYVAIFSFLPQDSRYLLPLLPLVCVAAAVIIAPPPDPPTHGGEDAAGPADGTPAFHRGLLIALLAIAPGVAYATYRLAMNGLPPTTAAQRTAVLERRVPEYRALMRAGTERVYVCGAEQLQYYAGGELLGDFVGPYSYDRILSGADDTAALAQRFRRIGVRYFLVSKRVCATPRTNGRMQLVYEDEAAQLWRVP